MFTTRPVLQGTFGMVASTHYLGTAVGMAVLEAGGNAVDAAVAAGFTLQVAEPHLNGPGGDLPLIMTRSGEDPVVLCGQGPAPAAATAAAMTDRGLSLVPGAGVAAAAIPGSTAAWLTLLRDHGTVDLASVLSYAAYYAAYGVPVLAPIAAAIGRVADLFRREWPSSAQVYLPDGAVPPVGSMLANPTLAGTYQRLIDVTGGLDREAGIDAALRAWSAGFVASTIDAFCRQEHADGSGGRYPGLLTGADLASWAPTYEPPVSAEFGDWTVFKTGPWGQGPVLLQQLLMLDGLDLRPGTADFVHQVTEVAKLAFADREAWYGDVDDVPLATLLSRDYAADRRRLIGEGASIDLRPGSPDGRTPRIPAFDAAAGDDVGTGGEPTLSRSGVTRGDTCHVDVVDRWGTMISATPSGGWLTSSPVIPELGFPLGTRLQMTTLEPGFPTTLTPGRRPRTTLSPSLGRRADGRLLSFGTPGGDQQDQWQLVFLLHHLTGGLDLQAAIDAPSFHTAHFPSSFHPRTAEPGVVLIEDRYGKSVIEDLRRRGHQVQVSDSWSLGRLSAVGLDPATGVMTAAANPRGMAGYAAGR